jgi:hypothetical protein
MATHKVGDQVTILPPYDQDPVLIAMQHHARVAEVQPTGAVMVTLSATMPADAQFGPFYPSRIVSGWHDQYGRWR